jgi:hypothetical protein
MGTLLDRHLMLHDAASFCGVMLIRPAQIGAQPEPIVAHLHDRDALLAALAPALADAWPEHPDPDEEGLEAFLEEAYRRFVALERGLEGEEGFVPAAEWLHSARGLLLEHLRDEIDAIVGGVHLEPVWTAWSALDQTRPAPPERLARWRVQRGRGPDPHPLLLCQVDSRPGACGWPDRATRWGHCDCPSRGRGGRHCDGCNPRRPRTAYRGQPFEAPPSVRERPSRFSTGTASDEANPSSAITRCSRARTRSARRKS